MTTLTAAPDLWRTELYRRLSRRLDGVIGAAAKPLESLKLQTVGDLVHLLPRRYVSSTDFSDLAAVRVGTEVVFFAEVESARMPERSGPRPRLSVTLTDGRTRLSCTFFGRPRMIDFWLKQLRPGETGIFAGKVGEFRGSPATGQPRFRHRRRRGGGDRGSQAQRRSGQGGQGGAGADLSDDPQGADLDHRGLRRPGLRDPGRHRGPVAAVDPRRGRGHRPGDRAALRPPAGHPRGGRAGARPGCASTRRSGCS